MKAHLGVLPGKLLAGALAMASLPAIGGAVLSPPEIFKLAQPAVLMLEVRDAAGEWVLGASAIALGKGEAVTQCDLINGAARLAVVQGQRRFVAYGREKDEARNLCRLDVPGLRVEKPEIALLAETRVGQRVYAVGNALGLGVSISEGVVSGVRDQGGTTWIQTTAALAPGSEGGGLFDERGRLVGMTDYRKRDGQNINFAAPAAWLPEVAGRAGSSDPDAALDARQAAACLHAAQVRDWKTLVQEAEAWSHSRPEQGSAWYWLGLGREGMEAHETAAQAFDTALQRSPDSVSYALAAARVRMALKQPDKALEVLRRAIARNQEEAALWYAKVLAEDALGLGEAGFQSLRETLRLNPRHGEAWGLQFSIARARNDAEGMRQAASNLTEIDPENGEYWMLLAQTHLLQGRLPRAMKALDRAEAVRPGHADQQITRGAILVQLGANRQAIEALQRGLAAGATQSAFGQARLGRAYYQANLYPEAIAAFREAVKLAPEQLGYQYELGLALKDGNHDEEALEVFLALQQKAPQDALPWRQLGFVQAKLGRGDEAAAALEQSLKLMPEQAKVWHALGETYARLDRIDDARRAYQKLRGLDAGRAEQLYRGYLLVEEAKP